MTFHDVSGCPFPEAADGGCRPPGLALWGGAGAGGDEAVGAGRVANGRVGAMTEDDNLFMKYELIPDEGLTPVKPW